MPDSGAGSTPHGEQDTETGNPERKSNEERKLEPISADTVEDQQDILPQNGTVQAGHNTILGISNTVHSVL